MKTFAEYEAAIKDSTCEGIRPDLNADNADRLFLSNGLAAEAGEFCGEIKISERDEGSQLTAERKAACKAELGDVLWYLAKSCVGCGFTLEEIAAYNVKKVRRKNKAWRRKGRA